MSYGLRSYQIEEGTVQKLEGNGGCTKLIVPCGENTKGWSLFIDFPPITIQNYPTEKH